jgi:hypothetical protein
VEQQRIQGSEGYIPALLTLERAPTLGQYRGLLSGRTKAKEYDFRTKTNFEGPLKSTGSTESICLPKESKRIYAIKIKKSSSYFSGKKS